MGIGVEEFETAARMNQGAVALALDGENFEAKQPAHIYFGIVRWRSDSDRTVGVDLFIALIANFINQLLAGTQAGE